MQYIVASTNLQDPIRVPAKVVNTLAPSAYPMQRYTQDDVAADPVLDPEMYEEQVRRIGRSKGIPDNTQPPIPPQKIQIIEAWLDDGPNEASLNALGYHAVVTEPLPAGVFGYGDIYLSGNKAIRPAGPVDLPQLRAQKKAEALLERNARVDLYTGSDPRARDSRLMLATDIQDKQLQGDTLSDSDAANMAALRQVRPLVEAHDAALAAMRAEVDAMTAASEIAAYNVTDPGKWP